jgi:hypothetical protein
VETKNFPALEAFVDDVKNSAQMNDNQSEVAEIPVRNADADLAAENWQHSTAIIDAPTVAGIKPNPSRLQVAAFAVLLTILAGVATGYFIYRANSSEKSAEIPVVQSSPESNLNDEQPATISDSQNLEIPDQPLSENVEQARNKIRSIEKASERETLEKPEITDEKSDVAISTEKPKSSHIENTRRTPAQNTRRTDPESDGETRVRVVKSEPAPDIESIFTGRPSWGDDKRQQRREARRQQRDEMSEEEWQEYRRERRQQRRKRQNRNPFPF